MFLEVIAKNLEDVIEINKSNASRIELCDKLEFGGYTPDYNLIKEACELSKIPVNVIVRHSHIDFYSSEEEKLEILKDIEFIKTTKANGIVVGVLNKDNTIDLEFLKKVIAMKGDLKITFHKAFDFVNDFEKEYEKLANLKIDNVLTSGGENISKGFEILKVLTSKNLYTKVLIGGGVTLDNIDIVKSISDQVHIGTAARIDNTFETAIDLEKIEKIFRG
ncbi:copper homeostasis protein [Spiroplasma chinense]|uniref:Copper homeostasis protein cutC homolog n=1 Tax=Spiroplasma chinense TaxID=216932 RepID=A0A5B9Y628_9MOLU|nr:copper homeostasis protein CutC [Spiroplasma chinense]QEH62149.1 copper homeostasis protein [Spiroplasma chinense]